MDKPILVSVVIPTFNRYESLFRAIESICNQSYRYIEIIVVDDNYSNQLLRRRIAERIKQLAYDVNYILPSEHLGSAETRNVGILNSNGEYIAFLDDDDIYYPTKIEKQLKFFCERNNNKLAMVYCYGRIIYPNGSIELERTDANGICIARHMKNNIAGTSFWMCTKASLNDIGGFESIGAHDDGIVILKLMAYGYQVDLVKEELVDYYVHNYSDGITGITYETLEADERYFSMCKKYFDLITKEEAKGVINHYYDDRNRNLIILKDNLKCVADFKIMKEKGVSFIVRMKCIIRYICRILVIGKENKRLKNRGMV